LQEWTLQIDLYLKSLDFSQMELTQFQEEVHQSCLTHLQYKIQLDPRYRIPGPGVKNERKGRQTLFLFGRDYGILKRLGHPHFNNGFGRNLDSNN
jgi:hypothetical protein